MSRSLFWIATLVLIAAPVSVRAENAAQSLADPVLDAPTLRCLGMYWLIKGDDNRNARVEVDYRKPGAAAWTRGPDLFRVARNPKGTYADQGGKQRPAAVKVPDGAWLFAGSIFLLDPDTAYEIKLKLIDPDGGGAEKTLQSHTIGEPQAPANAPQYHVVPGNGGGDGTPSNPYKGLDAAQKHAKPGDVFLLHAGTYDGTASNAFQIAQSGEEGKPIIWRAAGDGEATIDAKHAKDNLQGAAISADNAHDVWFEHLHITDAYNMVRAHGAYRLVFRRCHFTNCICGIFGTDDPKGQMGHMFIADNLFEGIMPWPTTREEYGRLPESRGIWLGGSGNVVCYNRFEHFKDGMDNADSQHCDSNDFHNNEVSECFDDGTEMDGSERNCRCFLNRYTNVFQGISFQPVYGGPVYAFRNVIYNCQVEPFKLHNSPSGAVMIHNTIVHTGRATMLMTGDSPENCYSRNNLFIGTEGRALDFDPVMKDCDFDYDGFGGASGNVFLKWNNIKYATPDEVHAKCPVEKHCVSVDPKTVFASGLLPPDDNKKVFDIKVVDVRLKEGSPAIDAGEVLPGLNDGFTGKAPDLGAYEFGSELPHYGPRPEK